MQYKVQTEHKIYQNTFYYLLSANNLEIQQTTYILLLRPKC
jgi:hypothetical protein